METSATTPTSDRQHTGEDQFRPRLFSRGSPPLPPPPPFSASISRSIRSITSPKRAGVVLVVTAADQTMTREDALRTSHKTKRTGTSCPRPRPSKLASEPESPPAYTHGGRRWRGDNNNSNISRPRILCSRETSDRGLRVPTRKTRRARVPPCNGVRTTATTPTR